MSAANPAGSAHLEPVFREVFLAGFREPIHVDILRLIGDFLHTLAVETFYWGGEEPRTLPRLRGDIAAAATDLDHAARFLGRLGEEPIEARVSSGEEAALCREAEVWAERLGRLVGEMRRGAGEQVVERGG